MTTTASQRQALRCACGTIVGYLVRRQGREYLEHIGRHHGTQHMSEIPLDGGDARMMQMPDTKIDIHTRVR